MDTNEKLLALAENQGLEVINYEFESNRIKGLYCDNVVAINSSIDTTVEKICILAEELGHYHTTTGNILNQASTNNQKQEYRARCWAYNKLIGLSGIVEAYKRGCRTKHEIADFFEITETFLLEALNHYKSKYGICAIFGNYVIYFEPSIGVLEMI